MTTDCPERAILYARVSGDDTANQGGNLEDQLRLCRQYAQERVANTDGALLRGWRLGHVEVGESGQRGLESCPHTAPPGAHRACADCACGLGVMCAQRGDFVRSTRRGAG